MQNENQVLKQKSNKGVIIVLIILVLGLCTYIAYDKFVLDKDIKTNEVTQTNVKEESKNDNTTVDAGNLFKQYINNIKVRKYATSVSFSTSTGYKSFMLGTDNKLYVETGEYEDSKIPGSMGSDAQESNGVSTGIENVVRIFKVYHSVDEGGAYPGLLVLKEDGSLFIIREPESDKYNLEKLQFNNIVDAYDTANASAPSIVVDIMGNQYDIK